MRPVTVTAPAATQSAATGAPPEALARLASVQGGLSPLLADLGAALMRSDLPPAVRNAAQALLSLGLDSTALDGKAIETAILKSGVFLDGMLAKGEVVALQFVIELDFLKGREKLPGLDVQALVHY